MRDLIVGSLRRNTPRLHRILQISKYYFLQYRAKHVARTPASVNILQFLAETQYNDLIDSDYYKATVSAILKDYILSVRQAELHRTTDETHTAKYFSEIVFDLYVSILKALKNDGKIPFEKMLKEIGPRFSLLERQAAYHTAIGREGELRSYVDVGLCATLMERIMVQVVAEAGNPRFSPTTLTEILLSQSPGERSLWIVKGRLALIAGLHKEAIDAAEAALRLNAVCPDAQKLLLDGLSMRRQRGLEASHPDLGPIDLKGKFCSRPFTTLVTGFAGKTFLCDCPAYLPFETGNVLKDENEEGIWNGPAAQEIRRSILDGDFSYCSRMLCGMIKEDALPNAKDVTDPVLRTIIDERRVVLPGGPRDIQLSHDQSCNLACPSCRNEIITLKGSAQAPYDAALERTVLPLLRRTNGTLMISGGGDPFASKHYRAILTSLDPDRFANLNVSVLTNALLLNAAQWEKIRNAHELIGSVLVSVDAARPETYADVRRPGNFTRLLPNLTFLSELRAKGDILVFGLCFVVQQKNFREMPEFVELGRKLGADVIWFQRIVNFGSFTAKEIMEADIALPNHPDHAEFLEVLSDPRLAHPTVQLFGSYLANRVQGVDDGRRAVNEVRMLKRQRRTEPQKSARTTKKVEPAE